MALVNVRPGAADPPAMIGPYRLVGILGEGGMGVVHLALDQGGRAVAVKVLKPHVAADPEARRRLGRELSSLRRVRHPNVAQVLGADLEAPSPYLVTAFIPARTLEAQVRAHGRLPISYVAHLGRLLAAALRAIHGAGVVHRDLKPGNVLLLDDNPVLIDFGIAHVTDESRITSAGLVMGTPGYLPPELVEGRQITPATDWWGWGASLAFAATGRAPFGTGPSSVVLDRVRRGQADLAGVDPRLAQVLNSALTVNPVWRGTGDMLVAGLSQIEPWRPGASPIAAALRPDEVRTVPVTTQSTPPPPPPPPPPAPPTPPPPPPGPAAPHRSQDAVRTEVVARPMTTTRPLPADQVPTSRTTTATPPPPASGRVGTPPVPAGPPPRPGGSVVGPGGPNPAPAPGSAPGARLRTRARSGARSEGAGTDSGARAVQALLLGVLVALAAAAPVAPGMVVVLSGLWLVLARVVDRTATATLRRRAAYGPRPTDAGAAVVALPWRVLASVPRALVAMVFPLLLAASAAFLTAAVQSPQTPDPAGAMPLAAGCVVGWLGAWWGPGGGALRRGSRIAARSLTRRRPLGRGVMVLLAFLAVSSLLVVAGGSGPDWEPVATLIDALPRPSLGSLFDWPFGGAFGLL